MEPDELPLDVSETPLEELIQWMKVLGHYQTLQRSLKDAHLKPGRSWEETTENIELDEAAHEAMESALKDTILYGRKSIRPISLKPSVARKLHRFAQQTECGEFDMAPRGSESGLPSLVACTSSGRSAQLVFRSRRVARLRITQTADSLDPKVRKSIGNVSVSRVQIEGAKEVAAFDILEIDTSTNLANMRIDDQFGPGYFGGDQGYVVPLLEAVEETTGVDLVKPNIHYPDLAPLIQHFHEDQSAGRMAELRFDSTTGAVRTTTMRGRLVSDLRQDPYYLAGKEATTIFPFGIAVAWDVRTEYADKEAELQLFGSRSLGRALRRASKKTSDAQENTSDAQEPQEESPHPLRVAVAHKAYNAVEYRFILDKLMNRVADLAS